MSDKPYNVFNPEYHRHKYHCNVCGIMWFSRSVFDDLCPNFHCESDRIDSDEIILKHIKKYNKRLRKIEELKHKIEKLSIKARILA